MGAAAGRSNTSSPSRPAPTRQRAVAGARRRHPPLAKASQLASRVQAARAQGVSGGAGVFAPRFSLPPNFVGKNPRNVIPRVGEGGPGVSRQRAVTLPQPAPAGARHAQAQCAHPANPRPAGKSRGPCGTSVTLRLPARQAKHRPPTRSRGRPGRYCGAPQASAGCQACTRCESWLGLCTVDMQSAGRRVCCTAPVPAGAAEPHCLGHGGPGPRPPLAGGIGMPLMPLPATRHVSPASRGNAAQPCPPAAQGGPRRWQLIRTHSK